METVRCPRCNKLLRADAQSCSRCGIALPARGSTRRRSSGPGLSLPPSQPSTPPASPHRAGHYSGLHPEDQPFQSSFFMRIQRPPEPAPAVTDWSTLLDVDPGESPQEEPDELLEPQEAVPHEEETGPATLAELPTLVPRRSLHTPIPETPPPPPLPRRTARTRLRAVPLLVTASVLCFLVASGLLTLLLLNDGQARSLGPQLLALPGELRVGDTLQLSGSGFEVHHVLTLLRDSHIPLVDAQNRPIKPSTDDRGNFQARVFITNAWSIGVHTLQASEGEYSAMTRLTIQAGLAGPPRLQLGIARIDLGADFPGTLTHKNMTLINAGGGQVHWQAKTNVAWLSLSPSSGAFAGNALVTLTANRANLAPQAYVGQVIFTQEGGPSLTLYVSMTVDTTPPNLVLSTASLAFAGTPVQSPAGQTVVIQNNGGQTLNWTSGTTTADGANWLSVTPASGILAANTSAILTVNVETLHMALGNYQGALSFSYAGGPAQQVAVTLTVNPPPLPAMHISPQSLSFSTN